MGVYKYIREAWKKPRENMPDIMKSRLILWRKQPACIRIKRPTRLDRARSLGYKAKEGIIIVRQRLIRGGRQKPLSGKRRPKRMTRRKIVGKSYQQIAEERAARNFTNCEVLNSYLVAKDGKYAWHEIILIDKANPSILKDKNLKWIAKPHHKGRAARGLTSAGKKSRGLYHKGKGAEKLRPSRSAAYRRKVNKRN